MTLLFSSPDAPGSLGEDRPDDAESPTNLASSEASLGPGSLDFAQDDGTSMSDFVIYARGLRKSYGSIGGGEGH